MATARDGCVVTTEPLSEMLRGFVDRWQTQRPDSGGAGARASAPLAQVGPLKWLAAETGLPVSTIHNVAYGRGRTTELRIADSLVTAIGCPEAFHDGTLEVLPNPLARAAARATCCSGSLTGV